MRQYVDRIPFLTAIELSFEERLRAVGIEPIDREFVDRHMTSEAAKYPGNGLYYFLHVLGIRTPVHYQLLERAIFIGALGLMALGELLVFCAAMTVPSHPLTTAASGLFAPLLVGGLCMAVVGFVWVSIMVIFFHHSRAGVLGSPARLQSLPASGKGATDLENGP